MRKTLQHNNGPDAIATRSVMEQLQRFRCAIVEFNATCSRVGMQNISLLLERTDGATARVQIRRSVAELKSAFRRISDGQDAILNILPSTVRETLSAELFDGIEYGFEQVVEQLRLFGDMLGRHRQAKVDVTGASLAAAELNRLIGTDLTSATKSVLRAIDACLETSEVAETSLAFTDELTGLPNRRALYALADKLWEGTHTVEPFVLLRFDLDRFKEINDNYGHAAGDAALSRAAAIMRDMTEPSDFVARVGGDEFVMIFRGLGDASQATAKTEALIEAVSAPFEWSNQLLQHGMSVGLAPVDAGQNITLDRLLHDSDVALYAAKSAGRGQHIFYSRRLHKHREANESLHAEIEAALEQGDFVPFFQPQVDGRTGLLAGIEALARWVNGARGVLTPAVFLAAIEKRNLSQTLDRVIAEQALETFSRWRREGLNVPCMSVNVSVSRLRNPSLEEDMVDLAKRLGLSHNLIALEILETAMIDASHVEVIRNAQKLSDLGFRIELDDFGTGHASVSNLRHFHVDRIKIDKSFVRNIDTDSDLAKITSAIIGLAHSLRVDALAEGVETPEERLILNALGCDQIQGYGVARPMSATEFEVWLKRTQSPRRFDMAGVLLPKSA